MLRTSTVALGLVVLALVGCGGDDGSAPSAVTTTTAAVTTTASGPAAFAADVAAAGFGTKDATDPGFLGLGNQTCQAFQDGAVSFGSQVQAYVESDAHPSQAQAETLVRSAVRNLCPEYSGMLP